MSAGSQSSTRRTVILVLLTAVKSSQRRPAEHLLTSYTLHKVISARQRSISGKVLTLQHRASHRTEGKRENEGKGRFAILVYFHTAWREKHSYAEDLPHCPALLFLPTVLSLPLLLAVESSFFLSRVTRLLFDLHRGKQCVIVRVVRHPCHRLLTHT